MACSEKEVFSGLRRVESGAVEPTAAGETLLVELIGTASSCDVWFSVPEAWLPEVLVRLYARVGDIRALVTDTVLGDVRPIIVSGVASGIALRLRGLPCTALEVYAYCPSTPSGLGAGQFSLQAWMAEEAPDSLVGGPIAINGPVRAHPSVALVAGQITDSGSLNERFHFLRVDGDGALQVNSAAPLEVEPTGTIAIEGTGSAGTPAGSVLTVQGPGSSGAIIATGSVTPTAGLNTPSDAVRVHALPTVWDGFRWQFALGDNTGRRFVIGDTTPTSGGATPTNTVPVNAFPMLWDGTVWRFGLGDSTGRRVVVGNTTPTTNSATPTNTIPTNAFNELWDGAAWRFLLGDTTGRAVVIGNTTPTTNSSTPTNTVPANAFNELWDGAAWRFLLGDSTGRAVVVGNTTPTTNSSTPTNTVPANAFNETWDGTAWRFALGDTSGRGVVIGNTTPTTNSSTPTNTVPVNSFTEIYDGSAWRFAKGDTSGRLFVAGDTDMADAASTYGTTLAAPTAAFLQLRNEQNATNTKSISARSNNRGDLYVVPGLPSPQASTQTQNATAIYVGGVVKGSAAAGAAAVLHISASNAHASTALYLCIVNKNSDPATGDGIVWGRWVPANTSFSIEFLRHIYLSAGVAWAWSTGTGNTVTLAGSVTGSVSILYAAA